MHKLLITAALFFGLAGPAAADYEEVRELLLDTHGLESLSVEAGAGNLIVIGEPGSQEIRVKATIQVPRAKEDSAHKKIKKNMLLSLERHDRKATLTGYFKREFWSLGKGPTIHLEVRVPEGLNLAVEDGTGFLKIDNVQGDLYVHDGTGSMSVTSIGGQVEIEDGTGSISVNGVGGDIWINDGTGDIEVRNVTGSVTVNDGVGHIDVADVDKDLIIVNSGTGGLRHTNVKGNVRGDT